MFDLACISGANGAGKSSLLDAITWAIFGQARRKDESLINSHPGVKAAEVIFTFSYEGQIYRIQRTLPRGKTSMLEFQIRQTNEPDSEITWKPLSERTIKETQARIHQILRLDYDTFINASFFLQGKADQFAQQPASKRKEILGNILGLELWEVYQERTVDRRKKIEHDLTEKDGQLQEIELELADEPNRIRQLAELESMLSSIGSSRKAQESTLENMRALSVSIHQQKTLVETIKAGVLRTEQNRESFVNRSNERNNELSRLNSLLDHAKDVENEYQNWQSLRKDLEGWEALADKFRNLDKERQLLLTEISNEKARLEKQTELLQVEQGRIIEQKEKLPGLENEFKSLKIDLDLVEAKLAEKNEKNELVRSEREQQSEIRFENDRLRIEMNDLKPRINKLEETEGATCPICGQPLSPNDRKKLIDELNNQGLQLAEKFRSNKTRLEAINLQIGIFEQELSLLVDSENVRLEKKSVQSQVKERIEAIQRSLKTWDESGEVQMEQITLLLKTENYLPSARKPLNQLNERLTELGYNPTNHDAIKQAEVVARRSESEYHDLVGARATIKPLKDEIKNIDEQIKKMDVELEIQQQEFQQANEILSKTEQNSPDIEGNEQLLFDIQEKENRLNQEVGAASQKVKVLRDQKIRRKNLNIEREDLAKNIGRLKKLERAFGKDGIPALLIEQALPEIESSSNEILDRLSDGTMSVRLVTQSAFKDKKRDDLKETLDILISDGSGTRDYDLFSGGEAFRVNFAIRLALSEVLAHRKGASLQTLVIDEGFGSQDAQGRQRLIEAINIVRADFAKVLVITHLDELKDAFQTKIEVTKTVDGSFIQII